jgi:DNA-binding CsgD family transcriptional regulator/tetratricopeptide (TPR) repeat protein
MAPAATPLAGRDDLLRALQPRIDACAGGRGSAVVLRGDPGAGTSRLLEEVASRAAAAGVEVLWLQGRPGDEEDLLGCLRRGLPDLPVGTPPRRAAGAGRAQAVARAGEALVALLEARQPVALLLDEGHRADDGTLQVVGAAARRCADRAVLVGVAVRARPRRSALGPLLLGDAPAALVLDVGPLPAVAVAEVAAAALGGPPGPALARELARTGGNPRLLHDLLEEVRRPGALVAADGEVELAPGARPVPPDLAGRAAARMADLSEPARQVVVLVALSDLTVAQVARLLDRTVAGVAGAVEEAVAGGLVAADGPLLRLRHDLLRDAVLDQVSPAVRHGLHEDLVGLLGDAAGPSATGRGGVPGDARAVAEAGRRLLDRSPSLAAALLRRAHLGGAPGAALDLARALVLRGDLDGARAALADVDPADDGARSEVALALAQVAYLRGDLRGASTGFEEAGRGLLAAAAAAPRRAVEGCFALAHAAIASALVGALDRADDLAAEAAAAAGGAEGGAARGTGLLVRGLVAALRGDLGAAVALAASGHPLATAPPGAVAHGTHPDLWWGLVLAWADRPDEAEPVLRRALVTAEELGTPWVAPTVHSALADLHLRGGRWDQAAAELDAGLAVAADVQVEHGLPWCLAHRAALAAGRGQDPAELLRRAAAASERLGRQGADQVAWTRGRALLWAGRHAEATEVLGGLWDRLGGHRLRLRQVQVAPDLLRAAVVADLRRAVAVRGWIADVVAEQPGWARAVAVGALADGLVGCDAARVRAAADGFDRLGDHLEAALVHVDAVRLLRGARPPGPARAVGAHRAAALAVLDAAGATALAEALESAAAAPSVARRPRPTTGWASLTPAQARIVALVGEGLSNAEIAARLTVSRRTVESHLYQAYDKLGLPTRVQLAVAAAHAAAAGWAPPASAPPGPAALAGEPAR